MATKANLQDTFLSKARRGEAQVTVFLVNGFQIRGVIAAFDAFTVVVMSDGKQNLIYKHAISTIIPLRPIDLREEEEGGERQSMRESNFVTKIIAIAAFLAVMVYFATRLGGYLVDPLTTTAAYYYESDDAISVSGYVVRQEELLPDHSGLVYSTRQEGERVGKGRSVATVYHSEAALADAQELEILEQRLEQLQYAQNAASGAQAVLKLDSSIRSGIFTLKNAVAEGNLTAASQESGALQTLVLKRDYTYSGEDELSAQIAALEGRVRSLRSSAQAGSSPITAPRSGYYASVVDGYETVLTPSMLSELTPSALRAITPNTAATSSVGKLILGNTWYYAAVVESEAVKDLREGAEVGLRFASGLDRDLSLTVRSISREENGEQVLILESDRFLSVTTLLRHQNAQLIFHSYQGIRVPKSALRVVTDTVADTDGTEQELRLTAVYCRVGRTAQLKPVRVVYEGEDYYLVAPDLEALGMTLTERQMELYSIRSGDEIIVTANDLYNGKVIG